MTTKRLGHRTFYKNNVQVSSTHNDQKPEIVWQQEKWKNAPTLWNTTQGQKRRNYRCTGQHGWISKTVCSVKALSLKGIHCLSLEPKTWSSRWGLPKTRWKPQNSGCLCKVGEDLTREGHKGTFWVVITFWTLTEYVSVQICQTVHSRCVHFTLCAFCC